MKFTELGRNLNFDSPSSISIVEIESFHLILNRSRLKEKILNVTWIREVDVRERWSEERWCHSSTMKWFVSGRRYRSKEIISSEPKKIIQKTQRRWKQSWVMLNGRVPLQKNYLCGIISLLSRLFCSIYFQVITQDASAE